MVLSRRQRPSIEGGRWRRRSRPGGVELGRRLKALPPDQSGSISFVLAASGLVAVGLEVVAVVAYARAVRRAYSARQLGTQAAVREAFRPGLFVVGGVHLSYRLYLKFGLVRWVERAVQRAERRSGHSSASHQQ